MAPDSLGAARRYESPGAVLAEARRGASRIRREAERDAARIRRDAARWAADVRAEAGEHRDRVYDELIALADALESASSAVALPGSASEPDPAPEVAGEVIDLRGVASQRRGEDTAPAGTTDARTDGDPESVDTDAVDPDAQPVEEMVQNVVRLVLDRTFDPVRRARA